MSEFHYVAKIPEAECFIDDDQILLTQRVFDGLGEYSCSLPTGPSPGRIYRRNLRWPKESRNPSNWLVYICEPDTKPGWVVHRQRRPVIATPQQIRSARIETLLDEAIF